ncbi:hypothetical protein [Pelagibius sp. Alg239-R121]|nr:hypothetical protein [Pelagibius sp. Alg239-R121]
MAKFTFIKTLQKFTSVRVSVYNHFNHDRHFTRRAVYRFTALVEWRQLAA